MRATKQHLLLQHPAFLQSFPHVLACAAKYTHMLLQTLWTKPYMPSFLPHPFPNTTTRHHQDQPLPKPLLLFTQMESTFKLHPLPKVALEALQAAASAEGCPEGMAIVGGLTEVSGGGGNGWTRREAEQRGRS